MRDVVTRMSARNIPPDPNSFMEIQSTVFGDAVSSEQKEGSIDVVSFIVENAPLFRYFAEHLPEELDADWGNALKDEHSLEKIEAAYAIFRTKVEEILSTMDPELYNELIAAIERGGVDEASLIFETHFHQRDREGE